MTGRSEAQSDERVSGTPYTNLVSPNIDLHMEAYQTSDQHEDACI